ncbi:glyoxalase [Croceiramulus getboli]|nr:glyoxalase [Flavobacteriaceae bacterium YJPT1-3]
MSPRDQALLGLRPILPAARVTPEMSPDEQFQNATLRPIAKLQHDLLIEVFRNYIVKHKNVFHAMTLDRRMQYIENAVQKDMKFRNGLKGIIIGQFTTEEYLNYIQNSSALNKRMMNIVKERLLSSIQLFEGAELPA